MTSPRRQRRLLRAHPTQSRVGPRQLRIAWISLTSLTVILLLASHLLTSEGESIFSSTLVGPLLLGALVLAIVAGVGYRREHLRRLARRGPLPRTTILSQGISGHPHIAMKSAGVAGGFLSVDVDVAERKLPMPIIRTPDVKMCPSCSREFQTGLDVCPFDDTPLLSAHHVDAEPADTLDTRRALMRCPTCEQEYDLGTRFCIFDGTDLRLAEADDASELFDGQRVCPECGEAGESDATHCSVDGSALVPQRPSRTHAGYHAIPLLICPECLAEYKPGMTHCPNEGRELLPLLGRTTGANPGTGRGVKSKICQRCGGRYGEDAEYCRDDGTALIPLN